MLAMVLAGRLVGVFAKECYIGVTLVLAGRLVEVLEMVLAGRWVEVLEMVLAGRLVEVLDRKSVV